MKYVVVFIVAVIFFVLGVAIHQIFVTPKLVEKRVRDLNLMKYDFEHNKWVGER